MALGNVSEELAKLKKEQSDTTSAVNGVADLLLQQINMGKQSRLDELETMREAKKASSSTSKKVESGTKKSGMLGLGFLGLPGMALPALAAVVASITGFDDAIKATLMATNLGKLGKGLSTIGKSIKSTLKAIDTFVLDIRTFPFARYIPKIKVDVPDNYKIKLPDLPKISFVDSLGKAMSALKARMAFKLKLPDLPKFTFFSGGVAATAEKLKDFGKINLDALKSKLPKFSLEIPEGLQNGLDKISTAFGKFVPGGGGLAGFLNVFETMLGTITKPLKAASKFLLAPLAPFLTLIDFVVGFYKGFTGAEEVTDRFGRTRIVEKSLGDKLMAGLEGGLIGIVKGITEAFDLLFTTVPAWLLDKFGFEKAAEFLRGFSLTEMVDPIWNGIKDLFKRYFGPKEDGTSRMAHIFDEFWNDLTSIFRKLFDFIPTFEELKKGFYDIMPNWLKKVFVDNDDGEKGKYDRGYSPDNIQPTQAQRDAQKVILTQPEINSLYRALALKASGIEQQMVNGQMENTMAGQGVLDSYNRRNGDTLRTRFEAKYISSGKTQLANLEAQLKADGKEAQLKEFYRLNQGMRGTQGNVLIEAPATSSSVDNSSVTYNTPAPINTPRTFVPGT